MTGEQSGGVVDKRITRQSAAFRRFRADLSRNSRDFDRGHVIQSRLGCYSMGSVVLSG